MKILIDMDGVLVDMVGGACKLFGVSAAEMLADWNKHHAGKYDCVPRFREALVAQGEKAKVIPGEDWGPDEFWSYVHAESWDWWRDLDAYPRALELWQICRRLSDGETWVASAPTRSVDSVTGKVCWMRNHFDIGPNRYMIGASKELMAAEDTVLIDDKDQNCKAFTERGGHAIVYPRPWNSRHEASGSGFASVLLDLGRIASYDQDPYSHRGRR